MTCFRSSHFDKWNMQYGLCVMNKSQRYEYIIWFVNLLSQTMQIESKVPFVYSVVEWIFFVFTFKNTGLNVQTAVISKHKKCLQNDSTSDAHNSHVHVIIDKIFCVIFTVAFAFQMFQGEIEWCERLKRGETIVCKVYVFIWWCVRWVYGFLLFFSFVRYSKWIVVLHWLRASVLCTFRICFSWDIPNAPSGIFIFRKAANIYLAVLMYTA